MTRSGDVPSPETGKDSWLVDVQLRLDFVRTGLT